MHQPYPAPLYHDDAVIIPLTVTEVPDPDTCVNCNRAIRTVTYADLKRTVVWETKPTHIHADGFFHCIDGDSSHIATPRGTNG